MSHPEGFEKGESTPGKLLMFIGASPFIILLFFATIAALGGIEFMGHGTSGGMAGFATVIALGLYGFFYIFIPAGLVFIAGLLVLLGSKASKGLKNRKNRGRVYYRSGESKTEKSENDEHRVYYRRKD